MPERTWWSTLTAPSVVCILLLLYLGLRAMPIHTMPHALVPDIISVTIITAALHRPILMPMVLAFALGLFQDIVSFAPLGLGALCAIVGVALVQRYRHVILANNFIQEWLWVSAILLTLALLQTMMRSIFFLPHLGFANWFYILGLNIAIYPLLALFFNPEMRIFHSVMNVIQRVIRRRGN